MSESTIRRHLPAFPGARRPPGESRGWLIPVTDLLAQGFTIASPGAPADAPVADQAALAREVRELRAELAELEKELDELDTTNQHLLRRAEVAEALAAEREQTIDALRLALSRIAPASAGGADQVTAASAPEPPAAAERLDPESDPEVPEASQRPADAAPVDPAPDDAVVMDDDAMHEGASDTPVDPFERTVDLRNAPTNRQRRIEAARRTLLGIDVDGS